MGSATGAAAPAESRESRVAAPLFVLVLCALLVLVQLYVAIPIVTVLGAGARAAPAAAALGTAYSLAYALVFLLFGPLSDRYGRKRVLVPGMAGLSVATIAVAASGSLGAVGGSRAVQGLLASSFAAVALAYVGEAFPVRWRSTAGARSRRHSSSPASSGRSTRRSSRRRGAGAGCSGWPHRSSLSPPSPSPPSWTRPLGAALREPSRRGTAASRPSPPTASSTSSSPPWSRCCSASSPCTRRSGRASSRISASLFAGASAGPLLAGLRLPFADLMLGLALLLAAGAALVAASGRDS